MKYKIPNIVHSKNEIKKNQYGDVYLNGFAEDAQYVRGLGYIIKVGENYYESFEPYTLEVNTREDYVLVVAEDEADAEVFVYDDIKISKYFKDYDDWYAEASPTKNPFIFKVSIILFFEMDESVNESKLNEGEDKDLRKAINLLYNVDDLIKKARLNDLDDSADEFYIRAKQELIKLLSTIRYLNQ